MLQAIPYSKNVTKINNWIVKQLVCYKKIGSYFFKILKNVSHDGTPLLFSDMAIMTIKNGQRMATVKTRFRHCKSDGLKFQMSFKIPFVMLYLPLA